MSDPLYFRLETTDYKFYLTISKGVGTDTVSIGGKKGECVNVAINTPESLAVKREYHFIDTATIPILAWDSKCAIDKDLAKGSGTIAMINTVLSETMKRYSYVKVFTFTDNSHITCSNGKEISLLSLSVIEYGKTWYERHFNAFIDDLNLNRKYKNGIKIMNDPELKMSFTDFKNTIKSYTNPSTVESLKPHYESSATYFMFFKFILDTVGKTGLCILVIDWIDIFVSHIFQFNPNGALWAIRSSSIGPVQIKNETQLTKKPRNQNGGGAEYIRSGISQGRVNINDILEYEWSL